jgi:hypothetical protein
MTRRNPAVQFVLTVPRPDATSPDELKSALLALCDGIDVLKGSDVRFFRAVRRHGYVEGNGRRKKDMRTSRKPVAPVETVD